MKSALFAIIMLVVAGPAVALDPITGANLQGDVILPKCEAKTCRPVDELLGEYVEKVGGPDAIHFAAHGNPWRIYGGDGRIMRMDQIADAIRALDSFKTTDKPVVLDISWSAWAPPGHKALAEQLSELLERPVGGAPGFIWFSPNGDVAFTTQARTGIYTPYSAPAGEPIMPSAAVAMPPQVYEQALTDKDGLAMRFAARSDDVFRLHPDEALAKYEIAAGFGDGVSAYNAALVRLTRGAPGDIEGARSMVERAAALDDPEAANLRPLLEAAAARATP